MAVIAAVVLLYSSGPLLQDRFFPAINAYLPWSGVPHPGFEAAQAPLGTPPPAPPSNAYALQPSPSEAQDFALQGVNGALVPPDDPATLAQALATLIADPAARERYLVEVGVTRHWHLRRYRHAGLGELELCRQLLVDPVEHQMLLVFMAVLFTPQHYVFSRDLPLLGTWSSAAVSPASRASSGCTIRRGLRKSCGNPIS
mgnify:CR=1 FL=1